MGVPRGNGPFSEDKKKTVGDTRHPPSSPAMTASPGRSCSELSPSSARPGLIFLVIRRLVFQKKPGSVFFSADGFCIARA